MDAVEQEFTKVVKRQKQFHKLTTDSLSSISTALIATKWDKTSKPVQDIQSGMKEYYGALGKLSKAIDKKFNTNLGAAARSDAFDGDKTEALDQAVALHFVRQGYFDLVDTFNDEKQKSLAGSQMKQQFAQMYTILDGLRTGNLIGALQWAKEHSQQLKTRGSHFEFHLHKLQFISLLQLNNNNNENSTGKPALVQALLYGRKEFGQFSEKYMNEIQRLMCSVVYCTKRPSFNATKQDSTKHPLASSPYADFLSPTLWTDIQVEFSREFCLLLGMSQDPPLHVCVNVGASALPTMIKLKSVMDERRKQRPKVEMWSVDNELPVEIPIPRSHRYHSVFACPVSKEQTTDANPPVMMPCGHVLSRESVLRLSKGALKPGVTIGPLSDNAKDIWPGVNTNAKLKCPYCPNETTIGHTKRIFF